MWFDDVLHFWFDELRTDDWFVRDEEIDRRIRERFADLHAKLQRGAIDIPPTPHAHLAAVIVLDQFSRNMFRNSPAAFACDAQALRLAQQAIERAYDRELSMAERQFLYMPFMHSEDQAVQARSVELFTALGDPVVQNFAEEHRDIIERFGRFPHRNAILQRISTTDELEFLKTHKGF
jgi:uncharacterized protein (DUF924 family)